MVRTLLRHSLEEHATNGLGNGRDKELEMALWSGAVVGVETVHATVDTLALAKELEMVYAIDEVVEGTRLERLELELLARQVVFLELVWEL